MRYFDCILQTLLLITAAFFAIAGIFDREYFLGIALMQFLIGLYQLVGGFMVVLGHHSRSRARLLHLKVSVLYLTILILGSTYAAYYPLPLANWTILSIFTIPAWTLAMYYYVISVREALARNTNRGSFLPNINF